MRACEQYRTEDCHVDGVDGVTLLSGFGEEHLKMRGEKPKGAVLVPLVALSFLYNEISEGQRKERASTAPNTVCKLSDLLPKQSQHLTGGPRACAIDGEEGFPMEVRRLSAERVLTIMNCVGFVGVEVADGKLASFFRAAHIDPQCQWRWAGATRRRCT